MSPTRPASTRNLTIFLSLIIGIIVGLVVVAFILLTGRLAARMYPAGGAAWRRVLIPSAGALVTGYLLSRYFPNARGSGIPQTKFAIFINNGYIALKTTIGKFLCCSASLASGIALGREGPSVHIGAGIASVLGRRFGLATEDVKKLVPAGCSAALAAAFNTPIAAVLFSLEEILGDLHAPVLGSVVIASATSWMVLHLVLGDQPLSHVPSYQLVHPVEFGFYAILGLIGGLASVAFVKLLLAIRAWFKTFPKKSEWIQPAATALGPTIRMRKVCKPVWSWQTFLPQTDMTRSYSLSFCCSIPTLRMIFPSGSRSHVCTWWPDRRRAPKSRIAR